MMRARQPVGRQGPGVRRAVAVTVIVGAAAWAVLVTGPAWAGTIKGHVRFTGSPTEQKTLPVTTDQYVCGKEKDAEDLVLIPGQGHSQRRRVAQISAARGEAGDLFGAGRPRSEAVRLHSASDRGPLLQRADQVIEQPLSARG